MITYDKSTDQIELRTENTAYRMAIIDKTLINTYYGSAIPLSGVSRLDYKIEKYEFRSPHNDRGCWDNMLSFEYSSFGGGDYRAVPLKAIHDGAKCDNYAGGFSFVSAEISSGKLPPKDMPSFDDGCDTLKITLDDGRGAQVELFYSVYEDCDLITRRAEIINSGSCYLTLEKALSACVDFSRKDLDMITFNGDWAAERTPERAPLRYGIQSIGSVRGIPGHQHNPSAVFCANNADEDRGDALGLAFVYSGNFIIEAQKHESGVRICAGIHPDGFRVKLLPGERFVTPETAMVFSRNGLGGMSRQFHKAIKKHLLRKPWSDMKKKRPVLINSWEAAYFTFNEEKLLSLAKRAKKAGCDLFVLDDGWFIDRNDDTTSLGDWFYDDKKFPDGIEAFAKRIRTIGLDFGIWFEPEAISETSHLFAAHPDWAFSVPGKEPLRIRNQLTLDFTREEVRVAIYLRMERLIRLCNVKYLKWDMNRSLADVYSVCAPFGEIYHRYVLGVYEIQERLCREFPELLLENCAGGGARFDCGMLYYSPQIWCSDNTDAFCRSMIQYGTSFIYPPACMGAHFSVVPNHTTGRSASVSDRMAAALSGTFGYELDMGRIGEKHLEELAQYSQWYRENGHITREGELYRLGEPTEKGAAWLIMTEDKREAVLFTVGETEDAGKAEKYLDRKLSYKQEKLCGGVIKYTAV